MVIGIIGLLSYPAITAVVGHNASTAQIEQTKAEVIAYEHDTWCNAMNLLTAKPVKAPQDPAANPSREKDYQFYITFLTIKEHLHC